ncbi:hypothetical protein K443DRAFT_677895 [Laccaria amethystina LaAM-08-1]|uniref:F-box domain-containing protein n=1 Tax=Laccaria amethystina LaAM-08-1 TaxID=1095629 RepID=A0A0C9Y234_9AGAR|nr:hypothetical protein K443DRAFT_677895 [Laccaria amethystina LaAM-08-1]
MPPLSAPSSPEPSPSLLPRIHTLPNELLMGIFLLNTDATTTIYSSQVCCRWRQVALEYPILWARMLDFHLDSAEWSEELLRRSQDLPIDVRQKTLKSSQPIRHLERALAHSHRWRTFITELDDVDEALIPALSHPAPNLEVFCLHVRRSIQLKLPETLFADDAPKLRELRLTQCDFIPSNMSIFGNLTSLSVIGGDPALRPNVAKWLQMLSAAPLLQLLKIERAVAPPKSAEALLQVTLPNLCCMHLAGSTIVCGQLLAHLDAPSLSQFLIACVLILPNDDFKSIQRFLAERFGCGRPDFDDAGCHTTFGGSFLIFRYKPQESNTPTPYLDIHLTWSNVTDTHIQENIMSLFVFPVWLALHSLMLQTTRLTLIDPNNIPFGGLLVDDMTRSKVASLMGVLATFCKIHTLQMSGEMQRIVFVLLLSVSLRNPDTDVDCLLPSLRKLELDVADDKVDMYQEGTLFECFLKVVKSRIEKGVGIEIVEFDEDYLITTQQVDTLRELGVRVLSASGEPSSLKITGQTPYLS